ncbi:MAG: hypothetical protein VB111_05525 [Clostridiaceae bacterium]|nr:hypothetical protein [Clostridiaceae bacterium]
MKALYDRASHSVPVHEFPVAASTAVKAGQLVMAAANLAVPVAAATTTAILGVALEDHAGSPDTFNPRADGTRLRVADSPTTVYSAAAPTLTASGGSTATVVASALAAYADDDLNGYRLVLKEKAASSANTDPLGTVYDVTDFTAATKTLTITAAGGAVTSGDVFYVLPADGALKGQFNAAFDGLTVTGGNPAALPLRVIVTDTAKREVYLYPTLHEFGNKKS